MKLKNSLPWSWNRALSKGLFIGGLLSTVLSTLALGVVTKPLPADAVVTSDDLAIPQLDHVFLVILENHDYRQIIGNTNAPNINSLASTYALATSYYGITHPSLPNYIATISGDYFNIKDDNPPSSHTLNSRNLADQLEDNFLTWKTYQQSLPYPGFTGTSYPSSSNALYAVKHNPFPYFKDIQSNPDRLQNIVPDTQLADDLNNGTVPNFSYIVPDQCHDMHGLASCSNDTTLIREGDKYVGDLVNQITSSDVWSTGNNAIIITWDENDSSKIGVTGCCSGPTAGGGRVPTIVITNYNGPVGVTYNVPSNHYSLLRTIEDAFGIYEYLNHAGDSAVTPLTGLF